MAIRGTEHDSGLNFVGLAAAAIASASPPGADAYSADAGPRPVQYILSTISYFTRGNTWVTPFDSDQRQGRKLYNFDEWLGDSTSVYNPIRDASTYDLYLDPRGDRFFVSAANAFQGSLVGSAAEGLVSKLYALLGFWPHGFDRFKDEQFVQRQDGTDLPMLTPPYSEMRWDPRRLFATLTVTDFKGALRDLLTGASDTTLDDGHRYSRKEMQVFWDAIQGECDSNTTLYGEYACYEKNAEQLMEKLRKFAELLNNPSPSRGEGEGGGDKGIQHLTPKQILNIAHEAGLTKQEIHFLALVARNQYRPEGLSAQDYPAYLECRDIDFDRVLAGNQSSPISVRAESCLRSAARIAAEPDAAARGADTFRTHPATIMDGFAAVRQRALVLSTFSRACQANLDFTSLIRFDPLAARLDSETNRRCLTGDIEALKAMQNPFAELDRGLLRESREDRALVKSIKSATPEPKPRIPHEEREFFEVANQQKMITMALDPKFAEEEPAAKGASADGKPDGRVPKSGAKGPPSKQEISDAIRKALAKAAADPKYDAKQKAAIEKLAHDDKRIAKLEAHYEQMTHDHKDDTDKAIERIEKNLTAAIAQTMAPRKEEALAKSDATEDKKTDKAQGADQPTAENAADVKDKDNKNDAEMEAFEREMQEQLLKEADALAATSEPPPIVPLDQAPAPGKLQSTSELVSLATAELDSLALAMKEGRPYRIKMDVGRFLVDSEINDAGDAEAQKLHPKYARDLARIRSIARFTATRTQGSTEDKAIAIVRALNQDYLALYSRDNALLTDFMQGKGGNCEAQTKLLLTALLAADLPNDSSSIVAVQKYSDHVQLVLYDGISGIVTNLRTGERVAGVEAPLYHPTILINGYLAKHGETSPVRDEDLMIADIPAEIRKPLPKNGGTNVNTNTNLKLPDSPVRFIQGDGEIPRHARVAPPQRTSAVSQPNYAGRRDLPNTSARLGNIPGPSHTDRRTGSLDEATPFTYDDYSRDPRLRRNEKYEYGLTKKEMKSRLMVFVFYNDGTTRTIFKYKSDALEYSRLATWALNDPDRFDRTKEVHNRAFTQFYDGIWYRGTNELLHRAEYDQLEQLFTSGLLKTHTLNGDQYRKLSDYVEYINDTFNDAPKSLHDVTEYGDGSYSATPNQGKVINAVPRLKRLVSLQKAFLNRLRQSPEVWIQYFEQHPEALEPAKNLYRFSAHALRQDRDADLDLQEVMLTAFLYPDRITYRAEQQGKTARDGQESRDPHTQSSASIQQRRAAAVERQSNNSARKSVSLMEQTSIDGAPAAVARDDSTDATHGNTVAQPGRPAVLPDMESSSQEEISHVARSVGKKEPLKLSPNPRARVKVKPKTYLKNLLQAFEMFRNEPEKMKKLAQLWTRDVSKIVLSDEELLAAADPILLQPKVAFAAISRQRPAAELTYPGPAGAPIPEDIAILLHRLLSTDKKLHPDDQVYLSRLTRALNGKTRIE